MGTMGIKPAAIFIRPATADDAPLLMMSIIALATHVGGADGVACTEDDLRRFGFGEKAGL